MLLKKTIILTAIMFISHYATMAQDQSVSKYIEIYHGTRGLTVYVTRYGDFEKNQSLVKITSIDHTWNNHIFLCKTTVSVSDYDTKVSYHTKINGEDYELMRIVTETGTIWLKGGFEFKVAYGSTYQDSMDGRNDLVNEYNNAPSKTNPREVK